MKSPDLRGHPKRFLPGAEPAGDCGSGAIRLTLTLTMKTILALSFVLASVGAFADNKNCKLTIRQLHADGKKNVDVEEVHAISREDCKRQAKEREKLDDDGVKVSVIFSFRRDD
jgi:hypothetical protein